MIIKNVKVYTEEKTFADGAVVIKDGRFDKVLLGAEWARQPEDTQDGQAAVMQTAEEEVIDGGGAYAIPGLIDIHFHGCKGYDFCDGTEEAIEEIARYEASVGVTGICPDRKSVV